MRITCLASVLAAGCSEYNLPGDRDVVPPADPPGKEETEVGQPPDWQNCFEGWIGQYTNLSVQDDWVDPRPNDEPAPLTPDGFDYWDDPSFETFDPTLDFGQNWWPVDDGLDGDPKYFAAHWTAWIRAWSDTNVSLLLGSQDDSWVYVNSAPLAEKPGIQEFVRDRYEVYLEAGQYPIEVWFAHRGSETSGFSLRVVGGDVSICYPDFGTATE